MKKYLAALTCFVILTSLHSGSGNIVEFEDTTFVVEFNPENVISSDLKVTVNNLPSADIRFVMEFGETIQSFDSTGEIDSITDLAFSDNLISTHQEWSLSVEGESGNIKLFTNNIPTGVLVHLKHVYSNWTAGQPPPPDGRGLGVGAIIDFNTIIDLIPSNFVNTDESKLLAEQILNTLLDSPNDYNGDGTTELTSDGFGALEYTYGLRDHINNAGGSQDASPAISDLADQIDANLTGSIIQSGNYGTFLSQLNSSSADLANLYQMSVDLLEAELGEANTLLEDIATLLPDRILPILRENYNLFRNEVYGANFVITGEYDLAEILDTSSTNTSDTPLIFPIYMFIAFPLLRRRAVS